jgi:hypothetical protein
LYAAALFAPIKITIHADFIKIWHCGHAVGRRRYHHHLRKNNNMTIRKLIQLASADDHTLAMRITTLQNAAEHSLARKKKEIKPVTDEMNYGAFAELEPYELQRAVMDAMTPEDLRQILQRIEPPMARPKAEPDNENLFNEVMKTLRRANGRGWKIPKQ